MGLHMHLPPFLLPIILSMAVSVLRAGSLAFLVGLLLWLPTPQRLLWDLALAPGINKVERLTEHT